MTRVLKISRTNREFIVKVFFFFRLQSLKGKNYFC